MTSFMDDPSPNLSMFVLNDFDRVLLLEFRSPDDDGVRTFNEATLFPAEIDPNPEFPFPMFP